MTYADLEPYYQVAEAITGVAGEHLGPFGAEGADPSGRWRSAPYPCRRTPCAQLRRNWGKGPSA